VVEGAHRCEAACQSLQEYQLSDPIPLEHHSFDIPPSSTLFKPIQTHVYCHKNDSMKLEKIVLKHFKAISKQVANQKKLIIPITWHYFFNQLLKDINEDVALTALLYEKQEHFFHEEVNYRDSTKMDLRSNQIKKLLFEIVTNAIFEYGPCKDLLLLYKKMRSTPETYLADSKKWIALGFEPYQVVSEHCQSVMLTIFLNSNFVLVDTK
jgi:hypothetical protein